MLFPWYSVKILARCCYHAICYLIRGHALNLVLYKDIEKTSLPTVTRLLLLINASYIIKENNKEKEINSPLYFS